MFIDAIVPAHNESTTIQRVVAVLRASERVRRVIVVDDGSLDPTTHRALSLGATVLRTPKNQGKGRAMLAGYRHSSSDYVGFFDADLLTLSPEHVNHLVETCETRALDMCCGLRDYGLWNPVQMFGPLITGERIISRRLLDAINEPCWSGYAIETVMNFVATRDGLTVGCVLLDGLKIRNKTSKQGFVAGMHGHWKMSREIKRAERVLKETNGQRCA